MKIIGQLASWISLTQTATCSRSTSLGSGTTAASGLVTGPLRSSVSQQTDRADGPGRPPSAAAIALFTAADASWGYQGTLGFGFPSALGVKVANPDRAVVSITGDGGFMFAMPELATAVQYGINVVTIVFDNSAYGNVMRDQETRFGGRLIGSELVNPDFMMLAESFGVRAYRVASPAELVPALEAALSLDAPALIHVKVLRVSEASPWRFIHPAT